jgi:hypothetical protein
MCINTEPLWKPKIRVRICYEIGYNWRICWHTDSLGPGYRIKCPWEPCRLTCVGYGGPQLERPIRYWLFVLQTIRCFVPQRCVTWPQAM